MQTRVLRFLLLAVLVGAGSGGVFWTWTLAQHVAELEGTGRQTATRIDRIETLLDGLTQEDFTYSAGQFDSTSLGSANSQIQHLLSETSLLLENMLAKSAPAVPAVIRTTASIAETRVQVRQSLESGLVETAAVSFIESRRARQNLREHLRQLRSAESIAVTEARTADLKEAWLVLGGVALLFAGALVRSAKFTVPAPDSRMTTIGASAPPVEQQPAAPAWTLDLGAAAALSSAVGRIQSEAALPALLERMATLLGAPGIVIWMTAGEELFPVAGHGYDQRQWSQLGPVGRSSLNATAAAWRTGALQVVSGASTDRAAIVAPMLGADRCIGVLAVEISSGRERDHGTQAIVTVIAAQLAGVLVAWPDASAATEIDALSFERMSASSG